MLHINSILEFVHAGIQNKDPRFNVINDEHVLDTKTGVEFHLYDNGGKLTRDGEEVADMAYFTQDEQATLFEIKKLITDPDVVAEKKAQYPAKLKTVRENLSMLFEQPEPVTNTDPVAEVGAVEYEG